jgi:hypothetical protein
MSGFSRMATVTASTKRAPAISGGKRGAPATQVAALRCTPLDPVDPELHQQVALGTPMELLQTFTAETDIREGDVLVVGSTEYPIRACEEWTWRGGAYRRLVVEELKR